MEQNKTKNLEEKRKRSLSKKRRRQNDSFHIDVQKMKVEAMMLQSGKMSLTTSTAHSQPKVLHETLLDIVQVRGEDFVIERHGVQRIHRKL